MMFLNHKGEAITPDLKQLMSSAFSQHGVGVFETLRYTSWSIENVEAHYTRLRKGGLVLGMQLSVPLERLIDASNALMENATGVVKWRFIMMGENPLVCVTTSEMPYRREQYDQGVCIGISSCKKCKISIVNTIKSINYLENRLEREAAKANGLWDVIFTNTEGAVTECTASNVFFIKNGTIYTPHHTCGLLEGTMRRQVIDFLVAKGFPVVQGHYDLKTLLNADEVFITNAIMGVMPVWGIAYKGNTIKLPIFKSELMCVLEQTFSIQEV